MLIGWSFGHLVEGGTPVARRGKGGGRGGLARGQARRREGGSAPPMGEAGAVSGGCSSGVLRACGWDHSADIARGIAAVLSVRARALSATPRPYFFCFPLSTLSAARLQPAALASLLRSPRPYW